MSDIARSRWLVFGGSGAVGRYLLRRLAAEGSDALAISRNPAPAWAAGWTSIRWLRGALPQYPLATPEPVTVLSAGPLDAFATACAASPPTPGSRVVALSSMSAMWKQRSPRAAERQLAAHLLDCESRMQTLAAQHAFDVVLLRPTLIYGAGIDRSLTPLLQFARRWRWLPWPLQGRGLREPVHADDVAAAMLSAATITGLPPLALPGATRLPFDALLERMFDRLAPGARLLRMPMPPAWLRRISTVDGAPGRIAAALYRSGEDQIAEAADWQKLKLAPRAFDPRSDDFLHW